jgi:hypothetical protein
MKYPKPTAEQFEDFARRALTNLPDSIEQRKADLIVLGNILPDWSHGRAAARKIKTALDSADQAQKEFIFGGAK